MTETVVWGPNGLPIPYTSNDGGDHFFVGIGSPFYYKGHIRRNLMCAKCGKRVQRLLRPPTRRIAPAGGALEDYL